MWPFSAMSLAAASFWSDVANVALLVSLLAGVISTFAVVRLSNVKERHWDIARDESQERIAGLEVENSKAKAALERAHADIANANKEIEMARAEAGKSNERAGLLEKEAADQRKRAADIEQRVSWRILSEQTKQALTKEFLREKRAVKIAWVANDPESTFAARQLIEAFKDANWDIEAEARMFSHWIGFGQFIPPDPVNPGTVEIVRRAFTEANLTYSEELVPAPTIAWPEGRGLENPILIFVGSKDPSGARDIGWGG